MPMFGERPAPAAERLFHRHDVAEKAEVRHPGPMAQFVIFLAHGLRALLRSRADLAIENLALRQQVAVLAERRPRPRLSAMDRLFWVSLRRLWSRWADVLVIVQPDTVVRWHRLGFRLFWVAIAPQAPGQAPHRLRAAQPHPPDGSREPDLGCPADPW